MSSFWPSGLGRGQGIDPHSTLLVAAAGLMLLILLGVWLLNTPDTALEAVQAEAPVEELSVSSTTLALAALDNDVEVRVELAPEPLAPRVADCGVGAVFADAQRWAPY